jgi:hypothetical protein
LNVAVSNQDPFIVVVQVIGKLSNQNLLGEVVIVNASVDQLLTSILDLSIETLQALDNAKAEGILIKLKTNRVKETNKILDLMFRKLCISRTYHHFEISILNN